ncbi:MAG TPA: ATP-binding protein [Burkholderiaceae bacterium]|nr:ATP-binding protein [Burkholderiaceae bacterium]
MITLRSPSLFWRTFLLIVALIVASLLAWAQSFRVFERGPRAQQLAQQMISIVNITKSALLYSDVSMRRELLADLTDNEGVRVVPREATDVVKPFPDTPLLHLAATEVIERLGPLTQVASEVNRVPGMWVSFDIEGDGYWVFIERDPLARDVGTRWIRWAVMATLLSILVAVAITRVVNKPLRQLAVAARSLGAGYVPAPLPDKGPAEIRTVNQSFNRMVADLTQLERDRAVLLAGISHDLRTPLTRLRLEIDINALPDTARQAMAGDIEQMDAIVGQFLDYARPAPQQPKDRVLLAPLAEHALSQTRLDADPTARVAITLDPAVAIDGYPTEVTRALENLLTNASRYGRDPESTKLDLAIDVKRDGKQAVIAVSDHGPGIPADMVERLLRPFERGDAARSEARGAGLGLAIVDRIARLHGGELRLLANVPSGLRAELRLPIALPAEN